jgi:hypothetical protein
LHRAAIRRVIGTAQVPVRFGEAVKGLFTAAVVGEIAHEIGERRDRVGVLARVEERHGAVESRCRGRRHDQPAARRGVGLIHRLGHG